MSLVPIIGGCDSLQGCCIMLGEAGPSRTSQAEVAMGTGLLVATFVMYGVVFAVFLAWMKPPRRGTGRLWRLLGGMDRCHGVAVDRIPAQCGILKTLADAWSRDPAGESEAGHDISAYSLG